MTEPMTPNRALVLSGGGGRGAFQAGVFEYLESIGWKPWNSVFDRAPWKRTLEKYVPEDQLAQVKMPLYMVATDITNGHPTVYTNGKKPSQNKGLYQKVPALTHAHLLASSSIPYVYAPIGIEDNAHWDGAVMYNSPLRPAIDAEAHEVLMVLLSPYHKLEENDPRSMVQRSALPPAPRGLLGGIGYVLDLALIGTFENDFEELRKVNRRVLTGTTGVADHREVKGAVIAPDEWISPLDIIRYGPKRANELRALGIQAARQTFQRIDRLGWDSLYNIDEIAAEEAGAIAQSS